MGSNNSAENKSRDDCGSTNISKGLTSIYSIQDECSKRDDAVNKSRRYTCISEKRKEAIEYFNSLNNLEEYCLEKSNFKARMNMERNIIKLSNTLINEMCQNYFDKELNSSLKTSKSSISNFIDLISTDLKDMNLNPLNNHAEIEKSTLCDTNCFSLRGSFNAARTQNKNKFNLQPFVNGSNKTKTKMFYLTDKTM